MIAEFTITKEDGNVINISHIANMLCSLPLNGTWLLTVDNVHEKYNKNQKVIEFDWLTNLN